LDGCEGYRLHGVLTQVRYHLGHNGAIISCEKAVVDGGQTFREPGNDDAAPDGFNDATVLGASLWR